MKNLNKNSLVPALMFPLSAAVYILRRALYTAALDEKGLLAENHPLAFALWAVVICGAALIAWTVWKMENSELYEDNFPPSVVAAVGHFLMAWALLQMALTVEFPQPGAIGRIWRLLGFLAGPAMVWGGVCRIRGTKPFFGSHAVVCLFLLLYLVSRYQLWSGNPQLQDYVFELLASVGLTLFAYQRSAFGADMGNRRMLTAMGLLSVLLCGGALYGSETPGMYLWGGVWAAADLCHPVPPKKDEVESYDLF